MFKDVSIDDDQCCRFEVINFQSPHSLLGILGRDSTLIELAFPKSSAFDFNLPIDQHQHRTENKLSQDGPCFGTDDLMVALHDLFMGFVLH